MDCSGFFESELRVSSGIHADEDEGLLNSIMPERREAVEESNVQARRAFIITVCPKMRIMVCKEN